MPLIWNDLSTRSKRFFLIRDVGSGTRLGRRQLHRFFDLGIQPRNSRAHMLDLVQVIDERGFLRPLLEVHFSLHLFQISCRPALHLDRRPPSVSQ